MKAIVLMGALFHLVEIVDVTIFLDDECITREIRIELINRTTGETYSASARDDANYWLEWIDAYEVNALNYLPDYEIDRKYISPSKCSQRTAS